MKLIIAIIQDEYINKVSKALLEEKIKTTKLASTGGFLKSGSTTLFIGVEDDQVDRVVDLIREISMSREVQRDGEEYVTVGGANLFIMNMADYIRI